MPISAEPVFVALGPAHVATGINNRVWFYSRAAAAASGGGTSVSGGDSLVDEQEYMGTVLGVSLNATHAAVLCAEHSSTGGGGGELAAGRITLHPIHPGSGSGDSNGGGGSGGHDGGRLVFPPRRDRDGGSEGKGGEGKSGRDGGGGNVGGAGAVLATCAALTRELLIYGTTAGTIELFHVTEGNMLSGTRVRVH